jgi:hypothetical protein
MRKKLTQSKDWPGRVSLVVFGAMAVLFGYLLERQGYLWFSSFNERFGRPSITYPRALLGLGGIFILIGGLPWKTISARLEARDARNQRFKHRR